MKEIKAMIQAQQLSKVVMTMQDTGMFPGVTISEVRRIDRNAPLGIGGIADRLMDPTPYVKLEILCADEECGVLADAIRRATASGKGMNGSIYICPVESSTEIFLENKAIGDP